MSQETSSLHLEGRRTSGHYRKLCLSGKLPEMLTRNSQETVLPHSARAMSFIDGESICLGYTPTDYVIYSLTNRTTVEVNTPSHGPAPSTSIGGMSRGALSGLGGYIGLGAKAKPCCFRVGEQEGFIAKESECDILRMTSWSYTLVRRQRCVHWH